MPTYTPSFSKRDLLEMFGTAANHLSDSINVVGVSTDTRTIEPGNAFIALRGENFDGHDHIAKAIEAGASVIVSEQESDANNTIVVADTLNALGTFGWFHRRRFAIPVIAVAGGVILLSEPVTLPLILWWGRHPATD